MIQKLAVNISVFLCRNEVINDEQREVCRYGFEIIISTIIGFSTIIALGGIFHKIEIAIMYLLLIVPLRSFTGGYHADTYLKCNAVFGIVFTGVLLVYKVLIFWKLCVPILILSLFSFVVIWNYGPVVNENKPLDKDEKSKCLRISLVMCSCYYLCSLLLTICSIDYGVLISLVIDTDAILMIGGEKVGKISNENFKKGCDV